MHGNKDTRFVYSPADDESVDAEFKLIGHPNISIQVAPYAGGFVVNEYGQDDPNDPATFWSRECGTFARLETAQSLALEMAGLEQ